MQLIKQRNVHQALRSGMKLLNEHGVKRKSRAGDVLVMPEPVTTVYEKPNERVIFWRERDANPFFHFMEGLWMIAGRCDVEWISQFNSKINQFSDDGVTFHGAYGYRWINHFEKESDRGKQTFTPFNQIEEIVNMLKSNPNERRCVLQMWDAETDLGHAGKDVPCNTHIYFKINTEGCLDMTVCNRSNDIIWGAYGANAVHMSMLQEFVASWLGVPVGRYWQMSNDYHAYVDVFEKHKSIIEKDVKSFDFPYSPIGAGIESVKPFPMVNGPIENWISDLCMFIDAGPVPGFSDRFFRKVVVPIWNSWFVWKETEGDKYKRSKAAFDELSSCQATDWKLACEEWLLRRVI